MLTDRKTYLRAMVSCAFFFAGPGFAYALFVSRLPAIRENCGADPADIGMALFTLGLASLAALLSSGAIIRKFSSRALTPVLVLAVILADIVIGLCSSVAQLTAACAVFGFLMALADVTMNTQAIVIERAFMKKSLSRLHASYSIGGISGAMLASAFASLGLSPVVNYLAAAVIYAPFVLPAGKFLIPDREATPDESGHPAEERRSGFFSMPFAVYLCGLLCLGAYMVEGSIAEWGSIFLHSGKGAKEATAALVFACFNVAATASRLLGDRLRQYVSDPAILIAGTLATASCLVLTILTPSPAICLLLYALAGIFLGPAAPLVYSRAGSAPGASPADASSVVGFFGYSGMLFFPPAIGFAARHSGLETALLIPVGLCLAMAAGSLLLARGSKPPENMDQRLLEGGKS